MRIRKLIVGAIRAGVLAVYLAAFAAACLAPWRDEWRPAVVLVGVLVGFRLGMWYVGAVVGELKASCRYYQRLGETNERKARLYDKALAAAEEKRGRQ